MSSKKKSEMIQKNIKQILQAWNEQVKNRILRKKDPCSPTCEFCAARDDTK